MNTGTLSAAHLDLLEIGRAYILFKQLHGRVIDYDVVPINEILVEVSPTDVAGWKLTRVFVLRDISLGSAQVLSSVAAKVNLGRVVSEGSFLKGRHPLFFAWDEIEAWSRRYLVISRWRWSRLL